MAANPASLWFRRYRAVSQPRVRLVCFPHAGGSASSYRSWPRSLPGDVELLAVQYPGRQDRLGEPAMASMDQLAAAAADALAGYLDRPLALFGHSMGASVAYEVALRLQRRPGAVLDTLLVSARLPPRHHLPAPLPQDDEALLADVRSLDPDGSAILDDPDMRDVLLPTIRADYRVADTYRPSGCAVVGVPVVAYVGDRDPSVTAWQMRAWAEITTAGFDVLVFTGHHFYLRFHEAELVHDIARRLDTNGVR
jgi:pyochelin biosynthetic protein PchC